MNVSVRKTVTVPMLCKDLLLLGSPVVDVIKVVLCYAVRLTQYAAGDGVTIGAHLRR